MMGCSYKTAGQQNDIGINLQQVQKQQLQKRPELNQEEEAEYSDQEEEEKGDFKRRQLFKEIIPLEQYFKNDSNQRRRKRVSKIRAPLKVEKFKNSKNKTFRIFNSCERGRCLRHLKNFNLFSSKSVSVVRGKLIHRKSFEVEKGNNYRLRKEKDIQVKGSDKLLWQLDWELPSGIEAKDKEKVNQKSQVKHQYPEDQKEPDQIIVKEDLLNFNKNWKKSILIGSENIDYNCLQRKLLQREDDESSCECYQPLIAFCNHKNSDIDSKYNNNFNNNSCNSNNNNINNNSYWNLNNKNKTADRNSCGSNINSDYSDSSSSSCDSSSIIKERLAINCSQHLVLPSAADILSTTIDTTSSSISTPTPISTTILTNTNTLTLRTTNIINIKQNDRKTKKMVYYRKTTTTARAFTSTLAITCLRTFVKIIRNARNKLMKKFNKFYINIRNIKRNYAKLNRLSRQKNILIDKYYYDCTSTLGRISNKSFTFSSQFLPAKLLQRKASIMSALRSSTTSLTNTKALTPYFNSTQMQEIFNKYPKYNNNHNNKNISNFNTNNNNKNNYNNSYNNHHHENYQYNCCQRPKTRYNQGSFNSNNENNSQLTTNSIATNTIKSTLNAISTSIPALNASRSTKVVQEKQHDQTIRQRYSEYSSNYQKSTQIQFNSSKSTTSPHLYQSYTSSTADANSTDNFNNHNSSNNNNNNNKNNDNKNNDNYDNNYNYKNNNNKDTYNNNKNYNNNNSTHAYTSAASFNCLGYSHYNILRNSINFYAASSVILVLCYLTTTTAATSNSETTSQLDKHPIFDETSSDKEILDLLLEKKRYDKRLLPPVNDEDFCCGMSSPDMAKLQNAKRLHKRGTLTVNVNVLLLSLASPDESSLKYEVEFLLNQQWTDPRLQYGNKSHYEFLNALHHHDSIWTPDTYFIMHGDFKDPIIPMHFALRIFRNGTITYAMRRHLILSCQGSLHIFPFDDPKCSFSMESISYEEAQIKYVWKNDEDTLRKSPSLTTLNAYLIKNQTTACDQNSWRGNYSCLRVDLIFTRDRAFYFTTVFIPGIILVTSSFITFWLEWNAVPARSMIGNYSCLQVELTFTRDRAYYFTTVFIPGIILVTSSFITFWLEWNAVPARVMIGVTTMLNFFTTSNGFRSTLPVVSNLTAMNVWDGVCMCFIYASLLEFVCVNYFGRKTPKRDAVYRPGENVVTQHLPAVLSRIGVILASPLEIIEREFHAAISTEKTTTGPGVAKSRKPSFKASKRWEQQASVDEREIIRDVEEETPSSGGPQSRQVSSLRSRTISTNTPPLLVRRGSVHVDIHQPPGTSQIECSVTSGQLKPPHSKSPRSSPSKITEIIEQAQEKAAEESKEENSTSGNGEKRREGGSNEIVACTICGGLGSPCTHSAKNGCATETCFVQVRKREPHHPIRVAKTIDVIARITFPTAYAIFLIFFFVHYKGFS